MPPKRAAQRREEKSSLHKAMFDAPKEDAHAAAERRRADLLVTACAKTGVFEKEPLESSLNSRALVWGLIMRAFEQKGAPRLSTLERAVVAGTKGVEAFPDDLLLRVALGYSCTCMCETLKDVADEGGRSVVPAQAGLLKRALPLLSLPSGPPNMPLVGARASRLRACFAVCSRLQPSFLTHKCSPASWRSCA